MTHHVTEEGRLGSKPHGGETAAIARPKSDVRQLCPGDPSLNNQFDRALDHSPTGKIGAFFLGEPTGARGGLGHKQIS
jgi:hypothetical protein